ncbi:MAG: sulfotransferase [Myxococcota bacterium]|nr:sulfotransferase [Myxococcota bacterium]
MTNSTIAPCFIIGEQRSGSNLLRLMLSQAGIAAPHPPHIITRMSKLESSYGDLRMDLNWEQLVEDVCTLVDRNPVTWSEVFPLDRAAVQGGCRERSTVAIFGAIMDLYARARGASMWACKSMQYSHFVENLESYFEAPRYIYLYRDGRDVSLSFKRAVVGEKHPYFVAQRWAQLQDAAAAVGERVGSERFFPLCYEELTSNPEPVLRALTDFLGVPFQKSMLDFHKSRDARSASGSSQLWQNVSRPLMKNNSRKFLKGLSREEIEIVESVAGPALDRLGYERVHVPVGEERAFSAEEIASFERINTSLKRTRRGEMDTEDLERRANQLSVLTQRVRYLCDLSHDNLVHLQSYLREQHIGEGIDLIEAGETERHLFFVIEGFVDVIHDGRAIARIGPGECVGEIGSIAGVPRTRSVRTASPARLFVLERERLEHMMNERPRLAMRLVFSICQHLATRLAVLSAEIG